MSEHKEGRPEWYERLRSDGEFPGRTFTAEKMNRIERQALSGEAVRRGVRVRLLAVGSIACVVAFAIWLVVAGPLAEGWKSKEVLRFEAREPFPSVLLDPDPTASSMPSALNVPEPTPSSTNAVRVSYRLKAPVRALPESQPYATSISFEGNTTDWYTMEDTAGDHVKLVDQHGNAGWVPRWYIVGESLTTDRVQDVAEPYQMIVDKPVTYRLYPDEPTPSGFELWEGKVVNVVRTYGEHWLEIDIVTYDSPYLENKWVRKDELIPYEASKAREGLVFQTTTLYNESGEPQQEIMPLSPIYIEDEQGEQYRIIAAGGKSGYLDKADFKPNPFIFKVIDQSSMVELGPYVWE